MKRITWLQFIRRLKREFPVDRAVIVQSTNTLPLDKRFDPPYSRWMGETIQYPTHYKVRINNEYTKDEMVETLIHEWAHLLSWGKDEDDHGDNWGIALALLYRTILG